MSETKRFVYADNAATTPVDERVLEAMLPYLKEKWGNPSSAYSKGREAASPLAEARSSIASLLGCKPSEIFFTASGSEADNWAIKGAASAARNKGRHIITTKFEHHAVLNAMKSLERDGYEVTYLDVEKSGLITPETVENAMREDTVLVAIMYANNEIGTVLPIKEIAEVVHKRGAVMFTDAVQAVGHIDIKVKDLGVDMLAFSGHKINAPKGIGALYIKTGTRVHTLIDGGGQERGRRGGTENVPYIVGLAKALELAYDRLDDEKRVLAMRERLVNGILDKIPYSFLNGDREHRLAGNANITFEYVEGESLLMFMDISGICCSTGSACNSASLEPSHVLLSIGVPAEKAHGSLRFTLSHENTDEDVDYILEKLPAIVQRLRDMSPLYNSTMERVK
ncbi:MAG: cysteine desulfurase NifS [Clostridia bacterium]|nr:cysteine desulfurase NifS [Clostridia bacterium]MBR3716026.1 cysteine desulfurase NifS [Clostridia bacterium]